MFHRWRNGYGVAKVTTFIEVSPLDGDDKDQVAWEMAVESKAIQRQVLLAIRHALMVSRSCAQSDDGTCHLWHDVQDSCEPWSVDKVVQDARKGCQQQESFSRGSWASLLRTSSHPMESLLHPS